MAKFSLPIFKMRKTVEHANQMTQIGAELHKSENRSKKMAAGLDFSFYRYN